MDDPIDPLSQEEKERKKLAAKLPKVEAELEEQILLWEKENGRQFQVCGVRYIEYVQTQRDNHEIEKQMVSLVTQYCCVAQRKHDSPLASITEKTTRPDTRLPNSRAGGQGK